MTRSLSEIDEGIGYIGFRQALELVYSNTSRLDSEAIPLHRSTHRVAAEDARARNSHPSIDVSLKDGYAIRSADIADASAKRPLILEIVSCAFAASGYGGRIEQGQAVKICSGAPIPSGADAVVSEEFCREISGKEVRIEADAGAGRNVLRAGSEVTAGTVIVGEGHAFLPGNMGLAAAAGISNVRVYRRANIAVMGVGDEVVLPGDTLGPGQVYSSNLITIQAWLNSFGIECAASVVRDSTEDLEREMGSRLSDADVVITSGGAWGSERDLVIDTLDRLGWQKIFHRVRMGPGKGAAFGLLRRMPIFCLPGGPASNLMAFLQLALPGILHMSGDLRPPLESVSARLTEEVAGRNRAWTEFKEATLSGDPAQGYSVSPCRAASRMQAIAEADGLLCIPEGRDSLKQGESVPVQILKPGVV